MCKISDKLKLCTCNTNNVEQLKHYWILRRPNGPNICLFGEAFLPANIGEQLDLINEKTILKMLNESNCFDKELQHQENDILEFHFSLNGDTKKHFMQPYDSNYLIYAFKFQKGIWKKTCFDPFGQNLEDIQKGKILRPFIS